MVNQVRSASLNVTGLDFVLAMTALTYGGWLGEGAHHNHHPPIKTISHD